MADTNQAQLSYVEETTFGTTPASALTNLRITGESFGHNIDNIVTAEIRADRQVTDLIQADAEASGSYDFELSFGSPPDDFLEGVLFTSWGAAISGGTPVDYTAAGDGISFAATDNSINDAANGFVTAGIRAGQWLRVSGCATSANNTLHKVLTVTAAKIVCSRDTVVSVDDGIGDTVRLVGGVNINTALLSAGNADGVYTFSTGNPTIEGIRVGQWLEIRGFTTAANNGYKRVSAVTTTTFTTEQTTATEAEGDEILIQGLMIRNDDKLHSYTIQRELTDIIQFFRFGGQVPGTLNLTVSAGAIITGSIDFLGGTIASTDIAQASYGTGSNTAAPTNDIVTAITNVAQIMEGSTLADIASDLYIQEISFSVVNNLRGRKAIGSFGNVGIGIGKFDCTGSINVLFNDETMYEKFLAATETGLSFKIEDTDGNAYIITFPRVKFETDDGGKATGQDADIVENMGFRALRDPTTNCTIQIDKFPATMTVSSSSSSA